MSRQIILLDVDGVLADFVGGICKLLGRHGFRRTPSHCFDLDLIRVFTPAENEVVAQYAHQPGFCASLDWYPGARDMVYALQELGEVYACTAPWWAASWCGERIEWLRPVIDVRNVIFATNKSLIRGDVLVEDNVAHLESSRCKEAILIDRPWNQRRLGTEYSFGPLGEYQYQYEPFERLGEYQHVVNYVKGVLDGR